MLEPVIALDDPERDDVRELLERHLAYANECTPPGHVHALDVSALCTPDILFFGCRDDGKLLAVGALRLIDEHHGELKSMHTAAEARGRGIGTELVNSLIDVARERGVTRLSLETGTMDAFAPARALYLRMDFEECEPFGEYTNNPNSICMTRQI